MDAIARLDEDALLLRRGLRAVGDDTPSGEAMLDALCHVKAARWAIERRRQQQAASSKQRIWNRARERTRADADTAVARAMDVARRVNATVSPSPEDPMSVVEQLDDDAALLRRGVGAAGDDHDGAVLLDALCRVKATRAALGRRVSTNSPASPRLWNRARRAAEADAADDAVRASEVARRVSADALDV